MMKCARYLQDSVIKTACRIEVTSPASMKEKERECEERSGCCVSVLCDEAKREALVNTYILCQAALHCAATILPQSLL